MLHDIDLLSQSLVSLSWLSLLFLCACAIAAGFLNATVGGGGLVMLPAQLAAAGPGVSIPTIFGTNKFQALFGNASAAFGFSRRVPIEWSFVLPCAALGTACSIFGATLINQLPASVLRPLIVVLLTLIALYTGLQPSLGQQARSAPAGRHRKWLTVLLIAITSVYEGFFGPGGGTFLMLILVRVYGMDFLGSVAHSKIINFATNTGALVVFAWNGRIDYMLGGILALFALVGSHIGLRVAMQGGNRLIRWLFLGIVGALILKLGWDTWA